MKITIPIYIKHIPQDPRPYPLYNVSPLFTDTPMGSSENLQTAISDFVRQFREQLDRAGREMRHIYQAHHAFYPRIEERILPITIQLKQRIARCKFLFIVTSHFNRKIVFTPSIPELRFDLEEGETLEEKALTVLTKFFRYREKIDNDSDEYIDTPEELSVTGKAWASDVIIEFSSPELGYTPKEEFFAMLGNSEKPDGAQELNNVGRCLDRLFPVLLTRAVARDAEIEELIDLLGSEDRRPILVIGKSMTGKTALIEEYVYRTVSLKKAPYDINNNVWLLAPQRLISGMSYVGQWENRFIAILDEAKLRNHILYFDDLYGLLKAGISANSTLNAAQVLKPYIERREVRVLAEITPEAFRKLREADRGFADMFQILHLDEPNETDNLKMLIELVRQLEQQHRCKFELDVLPTVVDLMRRHVRDTAFPGKAASFLRRIAIKHRDCEINRLLTLNEFQARNGLALWFIEKTQLSRANVIQKLQDEVIDQSAAINAIADAVCTAKAGINDTERPVASFLFLGPTGVGKTQCAKSLARYLFGNEDALIRFDMNEFITSNSVARLIGTFDQPEGLLTNEIRRNPYSVLLLDEIEKAHKDVFNLLLQVMSDGRLTDSLGRTSDFTNVILIMTSNLGVKEADSELGFNQNPMPADSIYTQAARKFFSPEFFNRIDRIIPFNRLNRAAIAKIAEHLITSITKRDGLSSRRCILYTDATALSNIVDTGYQPLMGARALKRTVEMEIVQPMARHLTASNSSNPRLINILPSTDKNGKGVFVQVQELEAARECAQSFQDFNIDESFTVLENVEKFLAHAEENVLAMQPDGPISVDAISPQHKCYFTLRELISSVRKRSYGVRNDIEARLRTSSRLSARYRETTNNRPLHSYVVQDPVEIWNSLVSSEDMCSAFRDMVSVSKTPATRISEYVQHLLRETSLIATLIKNYEETHDFTSWQRPTLMMIRLPDRPVNRTVTAYKLAAYKHLFEHRLPFESSFYPHTNTILSLAEESVGWFIVEGAGAAAVAKAEEGSHLFLNDNNMEIMQVKTFNINLLDDARKIVQMYKDRHPDIYSLKYDPIVRIYQNFTSGHALDLRSGLIANAPFTSTMLNLRAMLLSALKFELIIKN